MKKRADTFSCEDRGMKHVGQSFGKELLPFIGLAELISVASTEIVELETRQIYEDFNYVMQDGSWPHLEFQSRDGGVEDLRYFRQYEANVSSTHGVAITTYTAYTGNAKNPMTSFTEGVNTCRIIPILMGEKDGDQVTTGVWEEPNEGVPLTKQNSPPLVLTPLMSGIGSIEEWIETVLTLLKESEKNVSEKLSIENIKKLESTVYVFANKLLNPTEPGDVGEVSKVSLLGQMIFEDGMETGMVKIVTMMLKKNKTAEEIHEDADTPTKQIVKIEKSLES